MNTVNMMDTVIKLSNLDSLKEDKAVLLFYINSVKLSLQRRFQFRYNQTTTSINLVAGQREYSVPSDYLRPVLLRRPRGHTSFGSDVGVQFFKKYTDKAKFEHDYPAEGEYGAIVVGIANSYIVYGSQILIGMTPHNPEVLKFDYHRKLPDYDEVAYTEDPFSIFAFDALIYGTLEEVFSSYTYNESRRAMWEGKKREKETELVALQIAEEITGAQRGLEVFG